MYGGGGGEKCQPTAIAKRINHGRVWTEITIQLLVKLDPEQCNTERDVEVSLNFSFPNENKALFVILTRSDVERAGRMLKDGEGVGTRLGPPTARQLDLS